MKIIIEMPTPEQSQKATKPKPTLKQKVEYAIDCLDVKTKKKQAVRFLQEVNHFLNSLDKLDECQQHLLELTKPVISEHGIPADLHQKGSTNG